ncbi:MAG: VOC family protein [Acidobacteriota bacterium]
MSLHLRIARPVRDLPKTVAMYREGLGLVDLGGFEDHEGFDGRMLGYPDLGWHLEFTHYNTHSVEPTPTLEDLLVLYIPDSAEWQAACERMARAGFRAALSFNPYWEVRGRTFEDRDGYRVVLENEGWMARRKPSLSGESNGANP